MEITTIRFVSDEDIPKLMRMEKSCLAAGRKPSADDFAASLERRSSAILVAERGNQILGYALFTAPQSGTPARWQIASVAVAPNLKDQSVPVRIISAAEQLLQTEPFARIPPSSLH